MTNYNNLKIEEKEIVNSFKGFLSEIIEFFEKQFNAYLNNKDAVDVYDQSTELEKRFLRKANDILEECIWFIQKNEPRANHLRLIIAIINSLNDTKRMTNYVVSFTKFFVMKSKINQEMDIVNRIRSIGKLSIDTLHKLFQLIEAFDLKTIQAQSRKIFNEFTEKYKTYYIDSLNDSIKNHDSDISFLASSIILIKNFDRFVDHMINIIENLVTIL